MEIDYTILENELIASLHDNKVWILATCANNITTARSVSVINDGIVIYFQTDKTFLKYKQIMINNNVALCFSNISIGAIAEDIGNWKNIKDSAIKKKYIDIHESSFTKYGHLKNQVVIRLTPSKATFWKYIDGKPFRDYLLINDKRAIREEYLLQ